MKYLATQKTIIGLSWSFEYMYSMSRRDRGTKHQALLLLGCAFGFVYLLARQFQGPKIQQQRSDLEKPQTLPKTLDYTNTGTQNHSQIPTNNIHTSSGTNLQARELANMPGFQPLNALPQSFVRLGLSLNVGSMTNAQRVVITTQTNTIKWTGETKRFVGADVAQLKLNADAVTFYNDPSRNNILVVIEVSNNQQSLLMQIPYPLWRNDRSSVDNLIAQLTQY